MVLTSGQIGHSELKGRWGLPPVVTSNQRTFDDFSAASHYILKNLLDCISSGLGLKDEESLHKYHRDDEPSKSNLYFLHYPAASSTQAGVGQNMHTDIGSLTLLFAPQWGLQALSPDSGDWEWVEPKSGHAIINVGDTLRFLSGRRLRSALHRAVQVEGVDRSSISYFLRASDRTEFRDSDDVKTDAKKWYLRKYETYKQSHEIQRTETVLTGGMMNELVVGS
jgi:isopenicillin N synthase-like dioxygenase